MEETMNIQYPISNKEFPMMKEGEQTPRRVSDPAYINEEP